MKKVNIAYWIITIIFAGFMAFSGIMDALMVPEAIDMMHNKLGYPEYIIAFIGWAKVLGAVVLLLPGFPRLKEWAYAGMFIDLAGAAYSNLRSGQPGVGFMVIFFAFLFASYFLHHKRLKAKAV
ncbi:MAG: DoxX family protein [Flavipsychrobacter sp.]|nr:DoxX family protein [Flavipsychrobacter sp.]